MKTRTTTGSNFHALKWKRQPPRRRARGRKPAGSALLAAALLACCAAAHADRHTIPLFVAPAGGGDPQGLLRLVNDTDGAATVTIHAIDDTGNRTGPATLTLNAFAAVELSAAELRSGNVAKGLSAGLGLPGGNVRLAIDSDVPVVPSAYVRGADGALAAMNATVLGVAIAGQPSDGGNANGTGQGAGNGQDVGSTQGANEARRYDVTLFHPSADTVRHSRLRLINPSDAAARVTIAARDDAGGPAPGGSVQLTLPAGGARTLTARQLEAGDAALFAGRLGASFGNRRLSVSSDRPIQALNVTVDAAGGWRNHSTTAVDGLAPVDAAAFESRYLNHAIVVRDGSGDRLEMRIIGARRVRQTVITDGTEFTTYAGRYAYERIGRGAARITLLGNRSEWYLNFNSPVSGWYSTSVIDPTFRAEDWSGGLWRIIAPEALLDLGIGPDSAVLAVGTAVAAIALPEASGGEGELTYSLSPEVQGLSFDPATRRLAGAPAQAGDYLMTYRVRDTAGDTDWRRFRITVQVAGGQATAHGEGAALTDLPTGSWEPDDFSGGSVRSSTSTTNGSTGVAIEIELDHRGWFESGGYRYTCQSAGGCLVRNREVASGTVLQAPIGGIGSGDGGNGGTGGSGGNGGGSGAGGSGSGGGASDDHGDDRSSATPVALGSDTRGVLTARDIDYFRVAVSDSGTLEAYTTGPVDTVGRLERADGSVVISNDDGDFETLNFGFATDVSAGEYFIRVNGWSASDTGDYTLHVRFSEAGSGTAGPQPAAGATPPDIAPAEER